MILRYEISGEKRKVPVAMTEFLDWKKLLKGLGVAIGSFVAIGTVAALWENRFFTRMTPVGEFEIVLLGLLSVLLGIYRVIRRQYCSIKAAGAGSLLGFLGVACPVCNKILLLLFGGELLMAYYEPARIYLAAAGVLIAAVVVVREWFLVREWNAEAMVGSG